MIKRCVLYKATPRGSKATSSGRHCRKEGETETESGTVNGTGVGREPRIVEQNPIRETEREMELETERNPKLETERETKLDPKWKMRKRGNEERPEAEGNTAREGDKVSNLTNERYSRIYVVACRSTVGGYTGLYIHKIDSQPRSLSPTAILLINT